MTEKFENYGDDPRFRWFKKVPFDVFRKAVANCPEQQSLCENDAEFTKRVRKMYDELKLPIRATYGSAGYDFFAPYDFTIEPGKEITIPTGIRVYLEPKTFLMCVPRSGSGFKYGVKLMNSVGIIDEDFVNPDTGSIGHIMCKLANHDYDKPISFKAGEGIMQGIVVNYNSFDEYDQGQWNDRGAKSRAGGFGSTGR